MRVPIRFDIHSMQNPIQLVAHCTNTEGLAIESEPIEVLPQNRL